MLLNKKVSIVNGAIRKQGGAPRPHVQVARRVGTPATAAFTDFAESQNVGYFGANAFTKTFDGILPDASEEVMIPYYRDMYYHDAIAGSACDLTSTFPYSDWTLSGVDNDRANIYTEALSRLNMRTLINEITLHYLVDGDFIGTLVYDRTIKNFSDIYIHDRQYCRVMPSPFYAQQSLIQASQGAKMQQFLSSGSPYAEMLLRGYPKSLINGMASGMHDLNPMHTLHVPRRSLADRLSGSSSYLKRLMPVYLLEKVLYRGTLIEASKRQRATSHITVGDGDWEPTDEEISEVLLNFQSSEQETLGAWIATRNGVTVNDVRPAGDMWKWTDAAESLVNIKLRALGLSEAFLAGDACLAGDTLIPTVNGLVRIDSFGEEKDHVRNKPLRIKTTVDSRYGKGNAVSWLYNGKRETLRITTDTGNSFRATGNHQILVLNKEHDQVWVRADKLRIGDTLCVSRNKTVRTKPLHLLVPYPEARKRRVKKLFNKNGGREGMSAGSHHEEFQVGEFVPPKTMTPTLAYWLSLFISEGSTHADRYCLEPNRSRRIDFVNSDELLASRWGQLAKKLFDVDVKRAAPVSADTVNTRAKSSGWKRFKANLDIHLAYVSNRRLVDWLSSIGVYTRPGRVDGRTPSWYKQVPWSILEADEESQRAFLAGYAECDGAIGERTAWLSVSEKMLSQIQAILNSHGYQPVRRNRSVYLSREDSAHFWSVSAKYLSKKRSTADGGKYSNRDGLPARYWVDFVKSRKVYSDRYGGYYRTDSGEEICWSKNKDCVASIQEASKPWGFDWGIKRFNYVRYQEGYYDNFLEFLRALSPEAHVKFCSLMNTPFKYSSVRSIADGGRCNVYDLTMAPGTEPAFVANGVVVHNSYNTADAAVTTLMENVLALRNFMTHKVFSSTLFPRIALTNGLYKKGAKFGSIKRPEDILFDLAHYKDLDIPRVLWSKDLVGSDAPSRLEMLETLSEKGFPIALRTWASAANIDVGALLNDVKEDETLKATINEITRGQGQPTDPDNYDEMASVKRAVRAVSGSLRRKGLGTRKMDPDIHVLSKTGKKRPIYREHAHMRKENLELVAAAKRLSDPHYRNLVKERIKRRNGGFIPNILQGGAL